MDSNAIAELLPDVIRRQVLPGSTLNGLLAVMSSLHRPSEQALSVLPTAINPRLCPQRFLPMLIQWLDLDRIFSGDQSVGATSTTHRTSIPPGRVRELLAVTINLAQQRGTVHGLQAMLMAATGLPRITINEVVYDDVGQELPYHVQVSVPAAGRPHRLLIERIVAEEKPAHVTATVIFLDAEHQPLISPPQDPAAFADSERDL